MPGPARRQATHFQHIARQEAQRGDATAITLQTAGFTLQ
jgi:hypothetical protein